MNPFKWFRKIIERRNCDHEFEYEDGEATGTLWDGTQYIPIPMKAVYEVCSKCGKRTLYEAY